MSVNLRDQLLRHSGRFVRWTGYQVFREPANSKPPIFKRKLDEEVD